MHDNWKNWKTDVSEESRVALDEHDGYAPTARCDSLKSGNDNGYLDAEDCRRLALAFTEAANFLQLNDTSNSANDRRGTSTDN